VLIAGAQCLVGDFANQKPKLPLYLGANLHASYQLDEHVQLFGLINNLFNNRNATYGTFFNKAPTRSRRRPLFSRPIRARSHRSSRSPFMAA